ncbi:MAG: two-component sensor histidine kinase [Archangium gephyra]|uniref:histidine kinase n=1 Tax=Archangium gephyra TaxID=48 RepID=A0A2W5W648_9BACT|nr:MAG: two-component sensor histidine kinase [Archangium gephyra]
MRLLTRLVLSHSMPILVMGAALGVMLVSLLRMTVLLGELREQELGALNVGQELHRAGWNIEVAMRHSLAACEANAPTEAVAETLKQKADALEALLARHNGVAMPAMVSTAQGYVKLARDVLASDDACGGLRSIENVKRRWQLDEALTDAWVLSTSELHGAVARKDDEARRVGAAALSAGLASAVGALLLGLLVAQRLSRLVTEPLGELARVANRVGGGDFSAPPQVQGPIEVRTLGAELDRMRERLAELDALKQGFLASVSHEMRTPLSTIREALAQLGDGLGGPLNEKQLRLVSLARRACEREIRMVSTLLDLSRLRAGGTLRFQAGSSIDEAVREAIASENETAEQTGVTVELELQGEAPLSMMDATMVERAVANVVRNAVGVSRPGQKVRVQRQLQSSRAGRPGSWAVVTVRDEGPGVPPEIRQTVFDPFVTSAVARSPKDVGVGLGLALAREVARAHGGELELDAAPGPGATFHLWLSLDASAPALEAVA